MLELPGLSGELVAVLMVLAIIALTWLALRNPARYGKIGTGLAVAFLVLFAAGMGWNLAITAAVEAVPLKHNGGAIIDSLTALRTPKWMVISLLAIALYLWALPWAARFLGRGKTTSPA
jgi:hypothetical protein